MLKLAIAQFGHYQEQLIELLDSVQSLFRQAVWYHLIYSIHVFTTWFLCVSSSLYGIITDTTWVLWCFRFFWAISMPGLTRYRSGAFWSWDFSSGRQWRIHSRRNERVQWRAVQFRWVVRHITINSISTYTTRLRGSGKYRHPLHNIEYETIRHSCHIGFRVGSVLRDLSTDYRGTSTEGQDLD